MTLRSVHALSYLTPGIAQVPEPRIAGTDRIRSVCTIPAGVRWRVPRVTGTQTTADHLLTLAASDELIRARPIGNFGEATDDGLLTRAF